MHAPYMCPYMCPYMYPCKCPYMCPDVPFYEEGQCVRLVGGRCVRGRAFRRTKARTSDCML